MKKLGLFLLAALVFTAGCGKSDSPSSGSGNPSGLAVVASWTYKTSGVDSAGNNVDYSVVLAITSNQLSASANCVSSGVTVSVSGSSPATVDSSKIVTNKDILASKAMASGDLCGINIPASSNSYTISGNTLTIASLKFTRN